MKPFRVAMAALVLSTLSLPLAAQDVRQDSLRNAATNSVTLNFIVDGYYGYDFSRVAPQDRQPFFYSANRHNEFTVNLAMFDALYSSERVRGRLAAGFGTYFEANYAAEPQGLRHLFEASVGIKLAATQDIWLDAGILPSPYGYEGAISLDQLTYTRSLSAENSPYYVSGAKLTFPLGRKATLAVFGLNGWQNIRETNRHKSLGTQLQVKPQDGVLLNWSTYIGNERTEDRLVDGLPTPGNGLSTRWFSDLYAYWKASDRLELLALFDIGAQAFTDSLNRDASAWYTANAIARYSLTDQLAIAGRLEMYSDQRGVIIASRAADTQRFTAYGGSLGLDYSPASNVRLRIEHRLLTAPSDQFTDRDGNPTDINHFVTASLSARF